MFAFVMLILSWVLIPVMVILGCCLMCGVAMCGAMCGALLLLCYTPEPSEDAPKPTEDAPQLEIVMNELRRFKHSADFLANSSHIIESASISAS